jgi:hypothetical protein
MMQHFRFRALLLGLMHVSLLCLHTVRANDELIVEAISTIEESSAAIIEAAPSIESALTDEGNVLEDSVTTEVDLVSEVESVFEAIVEDVTDIHRLNSERDETSSASDTFVEATPVAEAPVSVEKGPRVVYPWMLWCHANGDNSLASFIDYNTSDMARAHINNNILVLVQADRPNDVGTFRYQVTAGAVTLIAHLAHEMGLQPGQEVVDGITWAQSNYTFNNLILDLWGHGSGIEDPNFRRLHHRGILFDDSEHTYLNNQGMSWVMDQVAALMGKKVDVFGTDACLMAGIEVGWQVRNSAARLVASETSEPGDGWSYSPFLNTIANNGAISADDVAKAIVKAYGDFYAAGSDPYTLSAMDLTKLQPIVDALHAMIDGLNTCITQDRRSIMAALTAARRASLEMPDVPDYIDLWSFLDALSNQLSRIKYRDIEELDLDLAVDSKDVADIDDACADDTCGTRSKLISYYVGPQKTPVLRSNVSSVRSTISTAKSAITAAILASRGGNGMGGAHGMTIYFPQAGQSLDPSYPLTKFANETRWLNDFLKGIMGYR